MDSTAARMDQIDVAYVAHLARLELAETEIREFQRQLDEIVEYIKLLRQADVTGVEPTAHAVVVQNVFRRDEPAESLDPERVLANAPVQADGQFIVPKIVE